MQSKEIQELTASEPLTIEQEYEMQQSWLIDDDKLTFIVLKKSDESTSSLRELIKISKMVGDVNLFLNDPDDRSIAEVEVMIADPTARNSGLATNSLLLLFHYAIYTLGIRKLVAKISMKNQPSLQLFTKLGFKKTKSVDIFQEVHMELVVEENVKNWIRERIGETLDVGTYEEESWEVKRD
ncbi:5498_t:CDS:2, partial [Paraglomus occultum]